MTSKAQLRDRWQTAEGKAKARTIEKALRNGKISKDEAFVEVDGKADLRGIPLAKSKIAGAALADADLSYADLSGAWIERSTFKSAIFDAADLSGIADHGNSFEEVRFVGTDFRKAALGYEGSKFRKCHFEKCKFKGAIFIRGEFEDCVFKNCDLNGVDFNVSSFERCKFIGKLDEVRFRGDYAFAQDRKEFGGFKKNTMHQVDFSDAILSWLAVTDGVAIDSVVLPDDDCIFRLDRLDEVLPLAAKAAEAKFSGKDREAAGLFFHVQSQYAKDQKHSILNLRDYAESGTSLDFPKRLRQILTDTRNQLDKGGR